MHDNNKRNLLRKMSKRGLEVQNDWSATIEAEDDEENEAEDPEDT